MRAQARSALLLFALALPLFAQEQLTLSDAVSVALESHPSLEAAAAGEKQAEAGIHQARAGYFPQVQFSETYQRGTNPVFAFGSLLNQGEFTERNFAVDLLNNPDPLNNFQSMFRVEQVLFDARRTKRAIRAARLRTDIAGEQKRSSESEVIFGVVQTYFGAVLATENLQVAESSMKTAQADLKRAQDLFDAGLATQADVLSVRVHLASVEQERIRAANQVEVAQTALNDALGIALDRRYELMTPLTAPPMPGEAIEEYERTALSTHPELRQAQLGSALAQAELAQAQSALWPQVVAQGVFQTDRQRFAARAGSSWLAGVSLRWDIWKGSENRARVEAARFGRSKAEAVKRRASSAIGLQVRRAYLELQSVAERVEVAATAVTEAEESHRIIQNRYGAGLTDVTELIRSDTALISARFRHLAALYEQRVAAAGLERAAGTLTSSSEVLR